MDPSDDRAPEPLDLLTVIAIALVAYVASDVFHEGVGHGGACLLVGGRPMGISSVHFDCDLDGLSRTASRVVSAGGSVMNVAVGLAALFALPRVERPHARYFTWLFMTVNLLQAGGYLMVAPLARFGDWDAFAKGLPNEFAFRIALTVIGVAISVLSVRAAATRLSPMLGASTKERRMRALRLTVLPYLAGGVASCFAGLFNPVSPLLILISAAASTLGGTAWLCWVPAWLPRKVEETTETTSLPRRVGWILAGAISLAVSVAVLGPGIQLTH